MNLSNLLFTPCPGGMNCNMWNTKEQRFGCVFNIGNCSAEVPNKKVSKPITLIKDIDHQQWIPLNDMKSVRSDAEVKCIVIVEEK
jgi:hypothetical protein